MSSTALSLSTAFDDCHPVSNHELRLRANPMAGCVRVQLARAPADANSLSFELPLQPNCVAGDDPVVLWLSPQSWLIVSDVQRSEQLVRALVSLSDRDRCVLTDTNHAIARLEVAGLRARTVLESVCGLDLRSESFSSGQCARTRLAQLPVIVHATFDGFNLYVDRSVARWVWDVLVDAADG